MVKYCIHCGKQNEDQATFCVACGQRFPDQATPPATQAEGSAGAAQPSLTFNIETGAGAHAHSFTDVFLRDSGGKLLLVARRPSLLHQNYTIVDGSEKVTGFIEKADHLTHISFVVQDANHAAIASVQVGRMRVEINGRRQPPSCWLEDAGGNKMASLVFLNNIFAFSADRLDGSRVFDASFTGGAGIVQVVTALERKSYTVNLVDPSFPLTLLLAVIAALDFT